jgi:hypothetical protein
MYFKNGGNNMGFFSSLLGLDSVSDPVLGRLEYRNDTWSGYLDWPNNEHPAGLFYHSKKKPDEAFRARVENIKRVVKRIEREIQQACFDAWVAQKLTIEDSFTRINSASDLWRLMQMTGLNMDDTKQVALLYSFKNEAYSDACFQVVLDDDKMVSVEIDV